MVKVELELVGELKNHGNLLENIDRIKAEIGEYISAKVEDPGGYAGDPGRKLNVTSEIPRGDLESNNILDVQFLYVNNIYSGKFRIKEIPDNIDIQSKLPISIIERAVTGGGGGGKRKRKKSRPKRKKSKMKRK
tara:strand:- start:623 stop:1024 length:402 start_codon:yes stop_codon:yes gene_type:complete